MPTSKRDALPVGEDGQPYFPVYFRVSCLVAVYGYLQTMPMPMVLGLVAEAR
jgi:hypothetical protein